MKKIKGPLILLITAFIWGSAFVAQTTAADTIEAFTFTFSRNIIAAAFLGIIILIKDRVKKPEKTKKSRRRILLGGTICGVVLFVASNLQQLGISIYPEGVAASGRAGFLTSTYVVMVALASAFSGRKPHPLVFVAAGGTIVGMYFLCMSGSAGGFYTGDILLLLCAVCFSAHILTIDRFPDNDGIKMSCLQFAVCGVLSMICAFIFETPVLSDMCAAAVPILYAALFSSGIAYTLQIIGQKYTSPAVAAIVMSLESVFAALSGWIILNERMSPPEIAGGAIVLAAVITAQLPAFFKKEQQ